MRGKGHENLKRYADDFERNALKSNNPRKELNKIPNINPKQVANLLNMSEGSGEPNIFSQKNPRIPRKKGQPAKSKKHSDLYTDEDPRGTIHGLGFKDDETARASVKKIENSGRSHAHKIQAAIAMEQRARVMGKKAEAAIYRAYIEKMKKKTKEMQKEDKHGFKCPPDYKFDKKLMACVPKKTRYKTVYAYPAFLVELKVVTNLDKHRMVRTEMGTETEMVQMVMVEMEMVVMVEVTEDEVVQTIP